MQTRSKLVIAAIAAIALLGLAVSTASAGRLSTTNSERGFRITYTPLEFIAAGETVRCNVSLEGSFTSATTTKTAGRTIGRVTRAPVAECVGGTASSSNLPWTVVYHSFSGTLPNITGITQDITNSRFTVTPTGRPTCNATTEEEEPARGIANLNASGEVTEVRAEENSQIGTEGGFLCFFAGKGRFRGTGAATVLGETAHTRITLI